MPSSNDRSMLGSSEFYKREVATRQRNRYHFMEATVCFNAKKAAVDEQLRQLRRCELPPLSRQPPASGSRPTVGSDYRTRSCHRLTGHPKSSQRQRGHLDAQPESHNGGTNVSECSIAAVRPHHLPQMQPVKPLTTPTDIVFRTAQRAGSRSQSLSGPEITSTTADCSLQSVGDHQISKRINHRRNHSTASRSHSVTSHSDSNHRAPTSQAVASRRPLRGRQIIPSSPVASERLPNRPNGARSVDAKRISSSPKRAHGTSECYPPIWDVVFSTAERQPLRKCETDLPQRNSPKVVSLEDLTDIALANHNRRDSILTLSHSSGRSSIEDDFNLTPFVPNTGYNEVLFQQESAHLETQYLDHTEVRSTPRKRRMFQPAEDGLTKTSQEDVRSGILVTELERVAFDSSLNMKKGTDVNKVELGRRRDRLTQQRGPQTRTINSHCQRQNSFHLTGRSSEGIPSSKPNQTADPAARPPLVNRTVHRNAVPSPNISRLSPAGQSDAQKSSRSLRDVERGRGSNVEKQGSSSRRSSSIQLRGRPSSHLPLTVPQAFHFETEKRQSLRNSIIQQGGNGLKLQASSTVRPALRPTPPHIPTRKAIVNPTVDLSGRRISQKFENQHLKKCSSMPAPSKEKTVNPIPSSQVVDCKNHTDHLVMVNIQSTLLRVEYSEDERSEQSMVNGLSDNKHSDEHQSIERDSLLMETVILNTSESGSKNEFKNEVEGESKDESKERVEAESEESKDELESKDESKERVEAESEESKDESKERVEAESEESKDELESKDESKDESKHKVNDDESTRNVEAQDKISESSSVRSDSSPPAEDISLNAATIASSMKKSASEDRQKQDDNNDARVVDDELTKSIDGSEQLKMDRIVEEKTTVRIENLSTSKMSTSKLANSIHCHSPVPVLGLFQSPEVSVDVFSEKPRPIGQELVVTDEWKSYDMLISPREGQRECESTLLRQLDSFSEDDELGRQTKSESDCDSPLLPRQTKAKGLLSGPSKIVPPRSLKKKVKVESHRLINSLVSPQQTRASSANVQELRLWPLAIDGPNEQ